MDILRNLFGNLTSGIIRLAVTVGIIAAVYFFIVQPVLDTTKTISSEANQSVQRSFEASGFDQIDVTLKHVDKQVERQLNRALKASRKQGDTHKLIRCIKRAHQNVDKIERCSVKF
jgi:hypothetical protein